MYGSYGFHQTLLDQERKKEAAMLTHLARSMVESYVVGGNGIARTEDLAGVDGADRPAEIETVSASQKKDIILLYRLLSNALIISEPEHYSKREFSNRINTFKKELLKKIQAEQAAQEKKAVEEQERKQREGKPSPQRKTFDADCFDTDFLTVANLFAAKWHLNIEASDISTTADI